MSAGSTAAQVGLGCLAVGTPVVLVNTELLKKGPKPQPETPRMGHVNSLTYEDLSTLGIGHRPAPANTGMKSDYISYGSG